MSTVAPSPPKRRTAVPHHRGEVLRLPRHSSALDPSDLAAVRRWLRGVRGPTAMDLFCGAGGLSLGLAQAGFSVLVGADSDAWAVETHTPNVGGLGNAGDLTNPADFVEHLDGWGVTDVDLVVGGVPCQPFSNAGRSRLRELVRVGVRTHAGPRMRDCCAHHGVGPDLPVRRTPSGVVVVDVCVADAAQSAG